MSKSAWLSVTVKFREAPSASSADASLTDSQLASGWGGVQGPRLRYPSQLLTSPRSSQGNGNAGGLVLGEDRIIANLAPGGDGTIVVLAGNGGRGGFVYAGPSRRTHPIELRNAPLVGDQVGPVAERAHVRAAGDAPDPVDGCAVPLGAVIEVERAVHGRFQVDLGHDLPVFRAHVPDMIRALLEHAAVLPRRAQAFGVPVVHPVPGAARGLRRACRKQHERRGEKCDRRDYRAEGACFGDSGAPFDPGSASREDALPIQVGRPAAAARRIFQWGRLEISIGLHRRQCRRSPGSVQLRSSRDDHAIRDRVANRFVSLPRTTQGVGPLEAPSRDTMIDGGWRRFHARQGKRMQRMHVFLLRSPPGRPGAGSRKSADQQPTLHEWIAGGWAEIALLPAARPPFAGAAGGNPPSSTRFFGGLHRMVDG